MATNDELAANFKAVVTTGDDAAIAALEMALTDDAMSVSPLGRSYGRPAVLEALANPRFRPLLAAGEWHEADDEHGIVVLTCTLPEDAFLRSITFRLVLAGDGRVKRVELSIVAGTPRLVPLKLTDEMKDTINGALDAGNPMLVTHVDAAGQPRLSYRGTVQAYSDDQLALWNRDPNGGMTSALRENPNLAFYLRDKAANVMYMMYGRAHIDDDPAIRETVFNNSPQHEQDFDFSRRGVAIVVDLDRVEGSGPNGRIAMARDASPPPSQAAG